MQNVENRIWHYSDIFSPSAPPLRPNAKSTSDFEHWVTPIFPPLFNPSIGVLSNRAIRFWSVVRILIQFFMRFLVLKNHYWYKLMRIFHPIQENHWPAMIIDTVSLLNVSFVKTWLITNSILSDLNRRGFIFEGWLNW